MQKGSTIFKSAIGNLTIKPHITHSQLLELIHYSNNDPLIKRFTSDPKRFKNRKAFDLWLSKERTIFTLSNEQNELLGIAWFGSSTLPLKAHINLPNAKEYNSTFALRLYNHARGKGLAKKFASITFEKFSSPISEKPKYWIETSADNWGMISVAKSLGFRIHTQPDNNNKVIMLLN